VWVDRGEGGGGESDLLDGGGRVASSWKREYITGIWAIDQWVSSMKFSRMTNQAKC